MLIQSMTMMMNPTSFDENSWSEEIKLLTVRNTYSLNLIYWGDEKMTELCGPGRNMV